jgi:nicotinate phosphoribosyltransferase
MKRTNHHHDLALLTDLYELTMAACYYGYSMFESATFSLFIREYPPARRYFVSAGLADVLDYLENFKFSNDDLEYLKETNLFKQEFLTYLQKLNFTGDVYALPEGRLFFANEPLLEITAPLIEAQIIETFLINALNLQTMIATKASRCVHAAWPRKLVDFSLRRTQGTDAGLKVARASFIGGFEGTSNVLAGKIYGVPIFGTMAHSFISCFEREIEAFRAYAQTFPENTILLVDTYDTLWGTVKAVEVANEMKQKGREFKGVRLDSGDIALLSQKVRKVLKESGFPEAMIFASGSFDEYKIQKVLRQGGDIDSFGVGTKMGVSADAPYFDMAYKLVKYADRPVMKLSPGKKTLVSDKQIFRFKGDDGKLERDVIGLRDDEVEQGEPLLIKIMEKGKTTIEIPALPEIQKTFLDEYAQLDERYKSLGSKARKYPVHLSPRLKKLQAKVVRELKDKELGEK